MCLTDLAPGNDEIYEEKQETFLTVGNPQDGQVVLYKVGSSSPRLLHAQVPAAGCELCQCYSRNPEPQLVNIVSLHIQAAAAATTDRGMLMRLVLFSQVLCCAWLCQLRAPARGSRGDSMNTHMAVEHLNTRTGVFVCTRNSTLHCTKLQIEADLRRLQVLHAENFNKLLSQR